MSIHDLIPWMSKGRDDAGALAPFSALQAEMNRLFEDFFEGFGPMGLAEERGSMQVLSPKVDVSETDAEIRVAAELPGMSDKDVDVTLSDRVLTIRGEKKSEHEDKRRNFHRVERSFGSFERSLPLPAEVDAQRVEATFENGVLSVVLPKVAPGSGKQCRISVRRGA